MNKIIFNYESFKNNEQNLTVFNDQENDMIRIPLKVS